MWKSGVNPHDFDAMCRDIENHLAFSVVDHMLQHIEVDMKSTLTYKDFYPEAVQYMTDHDIPYSEDTQDVYAKDIFDTFFKMLPESIILDKDTLVITINPVIWALEYGDFYKPTMHYVSKSIRTALDAVMRQTKRI